MGKLTTLFLSLLLVCNTAFADLGRPGLGSPPLKIRETDGSPTGSPKILNVPNGSLSITGAEATLSYLTSFTESDPLSIPTLGDKTGITGTKTSGTTPSTGHSFNFDTGVINIAYANMGNSGFPGPDPLFIANDFVGERVGIFFQQLPYGAEYRKLMIYVDDISFADFYSSDAGVKSITFNQDVSLGSKKFLTTGTLGAGATTVTEIRQTLSGTITRTSGYISSIAKTGGRTQTITRDVNNRVSSITDGTKTWTITRTGNYISSWTVT